MFDYIRKNYPGFVLFTHKARGLLAYLLFGRASKRLKIIAVTGTNGKTTTCHMIASILEANGEKVGMTSTTTFKIGDQIIQNKTNKTTVNPFALHKMLSKMVGVGCSYAVVETSSHAIKQFRNYGLKYLAVAMTNVERGEHLDYHKTFEEYVSVKARLFASNPQVGAVNLDDPSSDKFLHFSVGKYLTYSTKAIADVAARKILPDPKGTVFTLVTPIGQTTVDLKLPALFNVENALCAASVAVGIGIPLEAIKKGLEAVDHVPGRMEKVDRGQKFNVLIDYAVTPESFRKIFSELRKYTNGKLIVVFGSCGDRDRTKRPKLAEVASKLTDIFIITDEEPYSERSEDIIEEIAKGVPESRELNKDYFKILMREEAIGKALSLAQAGDTVVITGMGDQSYRVVGDKKVKYSERQVIKNELGKLGYKR